MQMECPKCGFETENTFCGNCGNQLIIKENPAKNEVQVQTPHTYVKENAVNEKKMRPCKTCGYVISKKAKRCPNCGDKNRRPFQNTGCFKFVLAFFIIIGLISGIGKLSSLYREVNADKQYEEFILYVRENGVYSNGEHTIHIDVSEVYYKNSGSNNSNTTATATITVNSSDTIILKHQGNETNSPKSFNEIIITKDSEVIKTKSQNISDIGTTTRTADIDFGFTRNGFIKSFYSSNSPFGVENSEAMHKGYIDLTLDYVRLYLTVEKAPVSLSDIGFENY